MKVRLISITLVLCSTMILLPLYLMKEKTNSVLPTSYKALTPEAKKQVTCLADNIYFEAAKEPVIGQLAVAYVTINRVLSGNYADTICDVVHQKTNGVCQFSWYCITANLRQRLTVRETDAYNRIREISAHIFINHDRKNDVTKGATFYHADYVNPRWNLQKSDKIGTHIFYKSSKDISDMKRSSIHEH